MSRRPPLVILACVLAGGLVAADMRRAPNRQITGCVLITGVRLYRATLSRPMSCVGVRCRFEPTCSRYAEACLKRRGALAGTAMSARRLLRCGPWTPKGTVDPAPPPASP